VIGERIQKKKEMNAAPKQSAKAYGSALFVWPNRASSPSDGVPWRHLFDFC